MDLSKLSEFSPKSFWQKTEGQVGKVGIVAILAVIGFFFVVNIQWIVGLLQNTLHTILLFVTIAAVLYIVFDKRTRTLVSGVYKSIIRFLTGIFVTIDPIGILKNYLSEMRDKEGAINAQVGNLKGEIGKINSIIKENQNAINKSQKMAVAAQKSGQNQQVVLAVRKAGRKQNFNKSLSEVADRMNKLYEVLKKVSENVAFFIEDLDDEIVTRVAEFKAIKAGHSAIKGAMGVFNNVSEEELFNQAMDFVVQETGRRIGEIEYFLEVSEKFIEGIDLENNMFEMEGLELLETWEKENSSIISNKDKGDLLKGVPVSKIKSTLKKERKSSYLDIMNEWKNSN
ncbi:MAG: hypothetical protein ABUK01_06720 [Leptospirales bacterium]